MNLFGEGMIKTAVISDCGKYRYKLTRQWEQENRPLIFVMLNPSTANSEDDDPTIRKCMGFARENGFSGIEVYNLFAFRSTEPKGLVPLSVEDRIGPENDEYLRQVESRHIVCAAWGMFPKRYQWYTRVQTVLDILSRPIFCVKKSGDWPLHPLYVKYGPLEEL